MKVPVKNLLRMLGCAVALLFIAACPQPTNNTPASKPDEGKITWTAAADGEENRTNSTAITFTFSRAIEGLTAGNINLENDTGRIAPGALSGSGTVWKLALASVAQQGEVLASIDKAGVDEDFQSVAVHKNTPVSWTAAADGANGTHTSTAIAFAFSRALEGLTAAHITVANGSGSVTVGALSGSGTDWTLALDSVERPGDLTITLNFGGVEAAPKAVTVYREGQYVDLTWTATADGEEGLLATTAVSLSFSGVVGLSADDIVLTNESGEALKRGLYGGGTAWTLALTVLKQGTVTVSVNKTGIANSPQTLTLVFVEESSAGPGGNPGGLTAAITLQPTAADSSGFRVDRSGGNGAARTRAVSARNGRQALYFAARKGSAQTLDIGGRDAAMLRKADPGEVVDAETPSSTKDLFIIDSSSIAGYAGGTLEFSIIASQPDRMDMTFAITLSVPGIKSMEVVFPGAEKLSYWAGEAFDRNSVAIQTRYTDDSSELRTDYVVKGFDTTDTGVSKTISVSLTLHNTPAPFRGKTNITMYVMSPSGARLAFAYGGRIDADLPQRGRYTLTQGRTLIIAPVLWHIPPGATFDWTVSGPSAVTSSRDEYLSFLPGTALGNYDVTVTASSGGQPIAAASTTVECVDGTSPSQVKAGENDHYAPGQFIWPGNWNVSLGGYGGSQAWDIRSVPPPPTEPGEAPPLPSFANVTGNDFYIAGNAFGSWVEPGIIWVMKDENKNGAMDDTWYELRGNAEELGMKVTRRYAVAYQRNGSWVDNLGNTGTIGPLQVYPPAPHWPDTVTLVGTLIDRNGVSDAEASKLSGYVDTMDVFYDIDDAVQADGTRLDPPLDRIDFIRVQVGENNYAGAFGEISTEIVKGLEGIGPIWMESRSLNGAGDGSGVYTYSFINKSGYDLTVFFKHTSETLSVPRGQTVPYTSDKNKVYYNLTGGNVIQYGTGGGSFVELING